MYHPLATRPQSLDSGKTPLNQSTSTARPTGPSFSSEMSSYPMAERPTTLQQPSYAATAGHDVERNRTGPYIRIADHLNVGNNNKTSASTPSGAGHSRDSSFLHDATHYDSRKGPEQYRVAQGDIPDNTVRLPPFIRIFGMTL